MCGQGSPNSNHHARRAYRPVHLIAGYCLVFACAAALILGARPCPAQAARPQSFNPQNTTANSGVSQPSALQQAGSQPPGIQSANQFSEPTRVAAAPNPSTTPSIPMALNPSLNNPAMQQSSRFAVEMRLRMTWGGGNSDQWKGTIRVVDDQGFISNVRTLGLANDSSGSIRGESSTIFVHQLSPVNFGGADFTLAADLETQIEIDLHSAVVPGRQYQATVTVGQLIDQNFSQPLDDQQNQFSIARAPGDRLRVIVNQKSLVFKPNQLMSLMVHPNQTGESTMTAACRFQIVPARSSQPVIWTKSFDFELDKSGTSKPQRMEIPAPSTEGVYDLLIDLEPNWYRTPVGGRRTSASRRIQFVVLEEQAPVDATDKPWQLTSEIDPAKIDSNGLGQFIGMVNRSLGNDQRELIQDGDRSLIRLNPGGWQAIEMSVGTPGTPHVIEIEYESDQPMAMGLSVLQPDATGQIPLIGCDSGVTVPETITGAFPGEFTAGGNNGAAGNTSFHRVVFWPGKRTPYLLIANRDETNPVEFGKIRIYSGPSRLAEAPSAAIEDVHPEIPKRKFMAFYEAPLFPENFDSHEYKDPSIDQPLDDWVTFYQGADRLVQFLKANSYRGAFVTVASEGSSIYPGRLLDASPKYDSGVFFSNGCDPVRKDVLEMLMRMFDREGLTLIPTVAMAGPLPAIEARRVDNDINSFDLIDFRNNKRTREQTTIPLYNPLNLQVQNAVTDVISELAARYAAHPAFESVAVICRGDTYTQLPGQQWGYDEETISRFRNTGAAGDDLLGAELDAWIDWRASEMTAWYADMLAAVRAVKPEGKLFLAPVDLYRGEEISSALSPRIHLATDFREVMLRMGFAEQLVAQHPGIVLLEPHRIAPNQPLASERVEVQVENSSQARKFFRTEECRGSLFTHRMAWAHFAELQQHNPFHQQTSALTRLQQLTPSGVHNRQRLIQGIRNNDASLLIDGGILLSSGQDAALAETISIFNALPAVRFNDVSSNDRASGTPVVVRQALVGGYWYFYAINSSPWPVATTVQIRNTSARDIESLSGINAEIATTGDGQELLQLELEPFGMFGGRVRDDGSMTNGLLSGFSYRLPAGAAAPLSDYLEQVQEKLVLASKSDAIDVLENPDFELFDQPSLSSWQVGEQPTARVSLETSEGHNGKGSLHLSSEGQTVWIRSNEFQVPSTGRVSVSAWIRTDTPETQPPVRIAIEGRSATGDYYRFGLIGAVTADSVSRRVDGNWQRFAVHFDDLPVEGLTRLRIGFDLMGRGEVWIDSVRVYDRWLDENDAKAVTQLLASAGQLLMRPNSQDSCRKILESYWPRFLDTHFETARSTEQASLESSTQRELSQQPSISQDPSGSGVGRQSAEGNYDRNYGENSAENYESYEGQPIDAAEDTAGNLFRVPQTPDLAPTPAERSGQLRNRLREILPSGKRR